MQNDEIKSKVKNFLSKYIKNKNLEDDKDFFAEGLLNSLFAMQLVLFVEKTFNIKVENDDLNIQNFNSVISITKLVNQKMALAE